VAGDELVDGRGRGAAGLGAAGVVGCVWAGRGDSTGAGGGVWVATSAARTECPMTPVDAVTRPVTRIAAAGRIMPVTYIDPHVRREWEGALELALRKDRFVTSLRLWDGTGEQVVEIRAGVEAGIAHVTVDPAIDDTDHRGHLADVAAH